MDIFIVKPSPDLVFSQKFKLLTIFYQGGYFLNQSIVN